MDKLDKKAFKILKTKQYIDVDAGDIAVALRCDDDSAQESLNSLKDQGLIENFSRDGKTFWRIFSDEPHQQSIEAEVAIEHDANNLGDTKEFFFDLKPKEPSQTLGKPINPEPQKKPQEKSSSDTEEFYINLLSEKPVKELEKTTDSKPQMNHQEKKHSETEEFYIDLLSKDSKATNDKILDDDQTRDWNMPELIYKAKVAGNGKFKKEKPDDKSDEDVSIKRSHSSAMWIIFAILLSIPISTGITMLVAMNVRNTANAGLQALRESVTEANAKRDQRMEVLSKKLNDILEKNRSFAETHKRKR